MKEDVISHLMIIRTWAVVNPQYGMGLSREDCKDVVKWIDDALKLLEEQNERIESLLQSIEDICCGGG